MSEPSAPELDLRYHGRMPPEISPLFNTLSYDLRGRFNDFVSEISLPHITNLDWWVTGPPSRNTLASPFFHYYCSLHLVQRLLDERKFTFERIVVDSRALKGVIAAMLGDAGIANCRVRYASGAGGSVKGLLKRVVGTPVLVARKGIQCLIARVTRRASGAAPPASGMVVIDTFVTPAYATSDRWYGSLWDNLTAELKAETFFAPTLVLTPLWSMYSVYRRLRTSARQVLIKEDYLGLGDLWFAARHGRRISRISVAPIMVSGHDISRLVKEELASNRDPLTTIESLLTYRFIKRLKQHGVEVRLAIDWFEGQVIDKAWNLGFKRYFPAVQTIGYRAFEGSPFYLCSYPIPIERSAGVIPDTIAVQGKGTIATVREFLPDLDVMVIPSFKSQHVWSHGHAASPATFTVLVALPISLHASVRIVEQIIGIVESLGAADRDVRVVVKPHPTASAERLREMLRVEPPARVAFTTEKSLPRLLDQSHVLVTEASSSCLEALACGVPVVIVENREGLTYDPVPATVSAALYRRASTNTELASALTHYMNWPREDAQRQRQQSLEIRAAYFEPITREGIDRFMRIEPQRQTPNA